MKVYEIFEKLLSETEVVLHNVQDGDSVIGVYDGRNSIPQMYNDSEVLTIYIYNDALQVDIAYEYITFDELDGVAAINCMNNYVNFIEGGVFENINVVINNIKDTLSNTDLYIDDEGNWYDEDGQINN